MTVSAAIKAAQERANDTREYRYRTETVELRSGDGGATRQLVGHAAVFNTDTPIGNPDDPWWIERIAPGAFRESITNDDVRALFNHDPNLILGRNRAGTLTLTEDDIGLHCVIIPGDTSAGRDTIAYVERGDITQMSFGFLPQTQLWEELPGGVVRRTLQKLQLFDVSPVTFAAFPTTDIAVREARAQGLLPALPPVVIEGRALSLARAQLALAERL